MVLTYAAAVVRMTEYLVAASHPTDTITVQNERTTVTFPIYRRPTLHQKRNSNRTVALVRRQYVPVLLRGSRHAENTFVGLMFVDHPSPQPLKSGAVAACPFIHGGAGDTGVNGIGDHPLVPAPSSQPLCPPPGPTDIQCTHPVTLGSFAGASDSDPTAHRTCVDARILQLTTAPLYS
jgi:hypothetical protein